ncbi:hypothetical protein I4U23_011839 [Adineta vaga]|nr:hypothetical protein I4U23_011839 [Adineta vaga]
MSSTSSQTLPSSSLHRSDELVDLTICSTQSSNSTSFALLHRTVELENLHDHINNDNEQQQPPTASKKILTKCLTVIGDGSDKQIA